MGLEIVEFIMALEERFDIEIRQEDIDGVTTVIGLFGVIAAKVGRRHFKGCPCSHWFYRFRRAATHVLGVRKRMVTPRTPLASLMPAHRQAVWTELKRVGPIPLPPLARPKWLSLTRSVLVFVVAGLTGYACRQTFGGAICGGICAAALFGLLSFLLIERTRVRFPAGCHTVGDLTRLLTRISAPLPEGQTDADVIWAGILDEMGRELRVKREDVRPETDFVRDLHL